MKSKHRATTKPLSDEALQQLKELRKTYFLAELAKMIGTSAPTMYLAADGGSLQLTTRLYVEMKLKELSTTQRNNAAGEPSSAVA